MNARESKKLIRWLLSDDTGISSKQIAAVMAGIEPRDTWHYPSDPSDLGRCLRLLERFPNFDVWEMRNVNGEWCHLVNHWGELKALYELEKAQRTAPKLYERMQQLFKEAK